MIEMEQKLGSFIIGLNETTIAITQWMHSRLPLQSLALSSI